MKLYLLKGWSEQSEGLEERTVAIYGVFSSRQKVQYHLGKLKKSLLEGEKEQFFVEELELDKPTDIYNFMTTQ